MAQPILSWYLNIGDDDTPVWQEVTDSLYFYFTGPDTTTKQDQLTPPTFTNYKWAEELWIAESGFNNPSQCKIFVPPTSKEQSANVLKVMFSNDSTSSAPVLTAYDNSSQDSTDEQMFSGVPWLKAKETTGDCQPAQNWIGLTDYTSNATTSNALSSTEYAVTCEGLAEANDSKSFALACSLPSDATTVSHSWAFSISYDYSTN